MLPRNPTLNASSIVEQGLTSCFRSGLSWRRAVPLVSTIAERQCRHDNDIAALSLEDTSLQSATLNFKQIWLNMPWHAFVHAYFCVFLCDRFACDAYHTVLAVSAVAWLACTPVCMHVDIAVDINLDI